jgi:hypothetical protein
MASDLSVLDALLASQLIAGLPDVAGQIILIRTSEHRKPTFRYAGNFTPVASPTDVIMIKGSATTTLRVKRIALWGASGTASGTMAVTVVRRTTQFTTQGSAVFTAITTGKHDPNDAAATGNVSTIGTANLTSVGTSAGNLASGRLYFPIAASAPVTPLVFEFATRQDKAIILRGVGDFVFINLNGSAVPASGTIDYEIELEEDAS